MLPSRPDERKEYPVTTGCLDYFPDALAEVAHASYMGNEQHHPGEPLHWDKSKSTDEADCLVRHLMQRGTRDSDGVRHTAKVAWRALALLQRELEAEAKKQSVKLPMIPLAEHPAATPFKTQWIADGVVRGEYMEDMHNRGLLCSVHDCPRCSKLCDEVDTLS